MLKAIPIIKVILHNKSMPALYSFEGVTWKVAPVLFVDDLFGAHRVFIEC